MQLLLKKLSYSNCLLLKLQFFLFLSFITKAQTVTCPANTNLGTLTCSMIGDPNFYQIHVLPDLLEIVMMPPYNMEITGILPQTAAVVEDSDLISFCQTGAREITRTIAIYNDENLNFVYDVGEEIGSCSYTISIEAFTEPPIFTAPPDIQSPCELGSGLEVTGEPTLSPNACSFLSYDISFTDVFANSECLGTTLFQRTWTVTDACGNQSELTQEIYLFDNEGPSLTIPADITVPCSSNPMDNSITGDISYAYDICEDTEVETFSRIVFDLTQENTPCPGSTTYIKRWAGIDHCSNATTKDQIIIVDCSEDGCATETPTITCPSETNLALTCNMIDNPNFPQIQVVPDVLEVIMLPPYNIKITGISSQTSLFVEDSDTISFCPDDAREVTRLITIYNDENLNFVYDEGEEISTCTFLISTEADTEAPTFIAPADIIVSCSSGIYEPNDGVVFDDNCPDTAPGFADFSQTLPVIGECPGEQIIVRTWSATDNCGNTFSDTQTITIIDTIGPEFTVPPDIIVPCGTNPMDNSITGESTDGYDVCEGVEVEVNSIIIQDMTREDFPCPGSTTYTKSWGAVDGCGNVTQKQQIIIVECPPDCSNQDACVGDILADPLPGECDCQIVEYQILGCADTRCPNYNPNVNCDDGSCGFKVFDLALEKTLNTTGSLTIGTNNSISFTITIYNEGILAAHNIDIIDYIPTGLILNDTNWTQSGTNAVTTIAGPLADGEFISVDINFTIDPTASVDTYTNFAEIFGAEDVLGDPGQDIDSTPDTNNENDYVNSPLYYGDEDDHDGAEFTLVDDEPCLENNAGYFCE